MSETVRSETNFLETRLERAYQRVNDHWIPSNPKLLARIKNGLDEGNYDLDVEFLLSELKTDLGLLTSCLKELIALRRSAGERVPEGLSPIALLRESGIDWIRLSIDRLTQRASTHSLDSANDLQSARLREAMVSSSTAEVLAEGKAIEGDLGFSAALLRQLGFLLISWNYPTVYQRATEQVDEEMSLEHALDEALGFSPQVLAGYVISKWGLGNKMQELTGAPKPGREEHQSDPVTDSEDTHVLKLICEVGEALARADNPECYPNAERDWSEAHQAIQTVLGPQGFKMVQEQVRKNCENYRATLPSVFSDTDQLNPTARIASYREDTLLKNNPFVKNCSPHLRKAFKELYAMMDRHTISQHSVRMIAHEIIPAAGFSAGCVYIYDPNQKNFIPRLKIGTPQLRTFGTVAATSHNRENDSVVIAHDCQTPMIEHSRKGNASDTASIAAVLGDKRKLGVLYLEIPQISLNDFDQNAVLHFKAIRKALEDALRL